jgi:hypothetical protein
MSWLLWWQTWGDRVVIVDQRTRVIVTLGQVQRYYEPFL